MKSKLATALVALTLVLTGCGSSGDASPSASTSTPSASTLTAWVSEVGLLEAITNTTNGLTADLANLTNTDATAANEAFAKRSPEILALADGIAAEPASNNAALEALKASMVTTLRGFGTKTGDLAKATEAERPAKLLAATTAMTALTTAIQALVDYISAHGTESIGAK